MNKKTKLIFNGAEIITSFIYICAICTALMYVLCRDYVFPCTVIMTAATFGIFMLFYKLRMRRLFAVLTFIGLFIAIDLLCSALISTQQLSFVGFIYASEEDFCVPFAAAAILLFSMIVGFTTAYFTVYLPRPCFLMLPSFIPLILGAKTLGRFPTWLLIFLAAGFFAALLGMARPEKAEENYTDDGKARRERLIAVGGLVIAAAVIFTALPRTNETRYSGLLESVFAQQRHTHFGTPALGELTNTTRPNTGNNDPGSNTLFIAVAPSPTFVSSGSYDVYKGEEGWAWTEDESVLIGYPDWQSEQKNINFSALINKLKSAASSGKLAEFKDEISRLGSAENNSARMIIYVVDNSNTSVILHPLRTFNASVWNLKTYRNSKDEIFTENPFGRRAYYVVEYYAAPPGESYLELLRNVDPERLLNAAFDEGVISSAEYNAFMRQEDHARQYRELVGKDGVTPEIQALADEITAGLTTDYEKAMAIERWYKDAGFYYDLAFSPEEPTAEYFLFKSKRGICTDFASASTLLLRAAGIPARYTEGYVLSDDFRDDYGRFTVTSAQAHAYATAYISGYGWIEIDGTRYANVSNIEDTVRNVMIVIVIAAAVIAVLAVVFRKQLSELFFAVSLRFKKKNDRVRAIYLRTRKLACSVTGADPKTATAEEVRDIISRTLYIEKEAAEITSAANELMYGGDPEAETAADCKRLYRDYRTILKSKRSMKK